MRPIDTEFYVYPGGRGAMGVCKRCCVELAVERKKKKRLEMAVASKGTDTPQKIPAELAGVREGKVA
jgi:hypothetical protein